jgi:hypothetical protein
MPTCSICLRTRVGCEWRAAEDVICQLRTYLQPTPPRLVPALCDACKEAIAHPRSNAAALEGVAA